MTTYVLRHGQTNYSKRYLVNGDPTKHIHLNEEGRTPCAAPGPHSPCTQWPPG